MTVQCVVDGVPAGNMSYKAHVVQDIYQLFDTHSIAGSKMSEKLVGKPYQLLPEMVTKPSQLPPEPTTTTGKRKRKKSKVKETSESPLRSSLAEPPRPALFESPRSSNGSVSTSPPSHYSITPPRPKVQGRWIKGHWCPHPYTKPDEFACYYVDRETGEEQYERPECWESDGSLHSPSSARSFHASADEYEDVYTNESVIKVAPDDPVLSQQYSFADQKLVHRMWKESQDIPHYLQHVPIPHGADWCHPDCLHTGDLPAECGYHQRWGRIDSCCPECAGNWCPHTRSMPGRDWIS